MKTKTNDGKPVKKPRKMWTDSAMTVFSKVPNMVRFDRTTFAPTSMNQPVLVIPLTAESVAELREKLTFAIGYMHAMEPASLTYEDLAGAVMKSLGITPRKRVLRPSANKGGK